MPGDIKRQKLSKKNQFLQGSKSNNIMGLQSFQNSPISQLCFPQSLSALHAQAARIGHPFAVQRHGPLEHGHILGEPGQKKTQRLVRRELTLISVSGKKNSEDGNWIERTTEENGKKIYHHVLSKRVLQYGNELRSVFGQHYQLSPPKVWITYQVCWELNAMRSLSLSCDSEPSSTSSKRLSGTHPDGHQLQAAPHELCLPVRHCTITHLAQNKDQQYSLTVLCCEVHPTHLDVPSQVQDGTPIPWHRLRLNDVTVQICLTSLVYL